MTDPSDREAGGRWRKRLVLSARDAASRFWARAVEIATVEPSQSDGLATERARAAVAARGAAELRGGVAKIAQMTAYFAGPDAVTDEDARAALALAWDELPPMPAATARGVIEAELGADIGTLFATFDETPMAAASIGQVHAATAPDGRSLAVKIQYPDIADALRSDLESPRLVQRLVGAGVGRDLDHDAIEAIRAAVLGELDYRREADAIERFGALFAGDPAMHVPGVDRALSSARVLTMTHAPGTPLVEAARLAAPAARTAIASAIVRFAWGAPLVHGVFNADPNPGNYLVRDGDEPIVAFLDFGCTAELTPEEHAAERAIWRALLHYDLFAASEGFRMALVARGMIDSGRALHGDRYRAWETLVCSPFMSRTGFRWTSDYAGQLTAATTELVRAGELHLPGSTALLWRQRLGVAAVIGVLDVELGYRALLRTMLGEPDHDRAMP